MSDTKKALHELERVKAPIEIVLLDDIARGIKEINRKIATQIAEVARIIPEGIKDEALVSVAGPNAVAMQPASTYPPWFQATIFNDGPSPVYVFLNTVKTPSDWHAPLNKGENFVINTVEAKIQSLWFANMNPTDTSSVRVQLLK